MKSKFLALSLLLCSLSVTKAAVTNSPPELASRTWVSNYVAGLSNSLVSLIASNVSTNAITYFRTIEYPLTNFVVITTNHSLGKKPDFYEWRLRCVSAEHGYSVGDELKCTTIYEGNFADLFVEFATTNVLGVVIQQNIGGLPLTLIDKTGGNPATYNLSTNKWSLVGYAH